MLNKTWKKFRHASLGSERFLSAEGFFPTRIRKHSKLAQRQKQLVKNSFSLGSGKNAIMISRFNGSNTPIPKASGTSNADIQGSVRSFPVYISRDLFLKSIAMIKEELGEDAWSIKSSIYSPKDLFSHCEIPMRNTTNTQC